MKKPQLFRRFREKTEGYNGWCHWRGGRKQITESLRWTATEVFGLDSVKPAVRHDAKGVARILSDGAHVLIDEHGAAILTSQASRLRLYCLCVLLIF
jgi:hypothetical protein